MKRGNMKIAVISCAGANFYSIELVLQRLAVDYEFTNDKEVILAADGVILPGVCYAKYAMEQLHHHDLVTTICNYRKPLLGICLGMQLFYEFSAEGDIACLGIFPGVVRHFVASPELIVPHMGWNNLEQCAPSKLLENIDLAQDVYFVHSYYAPVNEVSLASCNYGVRFSAIAQRNNFYAMQFHPEKSGIMGQLLLGNFVNIVRAWS